MPKRRGQAKRRELIQVGGELAASPRGKTLSTEEKKMLITRVKRLKAPVKAFVQEIFEQARRARGRLDEDVYGVLDATLEALRQTGDTPPPIVFGVSHFETGEVQQVGFMPDGMTELPRGGKFITNHPAFLPSDVKTLAPTDPEPGRLKE